MELLGRLGQITSSINYNNFKELF